MKLFRKIKNIFREGIKGIWKHRTMGMASIISTFTTLFVIGITLILTITVNHIAYQFQGKVDEIEIFIKKDATALQIELLKDKIEAVKFKKTIEFRSSRDALELMKKSWGEDAKLLEGITNDNILPASYLVKIEDISTAEEFISSVKSDPAVDEIRYYKDLIDKVYNLSKYVRIFGAGLIVVLIVISLFIISNTIKLTVISRKHEISVMRYVGATDNYIRIPFVLEGLFFGVVGSTIAYLVVYYLYSFGYNSLGIKFLENFQVFSLLEPEVFRMSLIQIFLSMGIGIGITGSILSIRKYLKD